MKRLMFLATGLTAAIVASGLPIWTAAADSEPDRTRFESLEWTGSSVAMTSEAATRDSDGDGWSDWYERLEGTDPRDPASHPGVISLEIVGRTVFVQSQAFPDRLVMIDLQLPEYTDGVADLLATIDGLGVSGLRKVRDEMKEAAAGLGTDVVASVLKEADAMLGSKAAGQFEYRVGGQAVSLISTITRARNSAGEHVETITSPGRVAELTFHRDGTTTGTDVRNYVDADGNGAVMTLKTENGKVVSISVTTYEAGKAVKVESVATNGTSTSSAMPTQSSAKPTENSEKPTESSEKPTESSEKPTETSAGTATTKPTDTTKPTETTAGGYRDPEADPMVLPTAAEIAERVAFLVNVNTRFGSTGVLLTEIPKDRPGVADPEEPPCDDDRCAVFVVLDAPDLTKTSGGCPPTYCNGTDPRNRP